MSNFESSGTSKYSPGKYIENPNYFTPAQEKYLNNEVKEMNEDALLEDDYGKLYSNDFIETRKAEVTQAKNSHKFDDRIKSLKSEIDENPTITEEYRKVSEYLEALFYKKLGGKDGWIPNAIVWKASKYDDYIKGIDFIIETDDKEFALATDLTFSHEKNLVHKLERIKRNITKGELPSAIFYERVGDKKNPIPLVVIAVEHEKVLKALALWADGQGNVLENHPLKAKTMLELEAQLESFAIYAKSIGKRDIASSYNDMLAKIQLLIINHEETIRKYQGLIDNDRAYATIMKFCGDLKKETEKNQDKNS